MLKKLFNFLLLCLLIPRLLFEIGLFIVQYGLIKSKTKKETIPLFLLILLIIWLINWRLWQKQQKPVIELKTAPSHEAGELLLTLEKEDMEKLKNFYQELKNRQEHSRDILFNLGKLLELEDPQSAQEKFEQSYELDPNYSWKIKPQFKNYSNLF